VVEGYVKLPLYRVVSSSVCVWVSVRVGGVGVCLGECVCVQVFVCESGMCLGECLSECVCVQV